LIDPLKLLNTLHSLSAVDEARAVSLNQLSRILGVDPRELEEPLHILHAMEYVIIKGTRVYLSELGILKISSTFC